MDKRRIKREIKTLSRIASIDYDLGQRRVTVVNMRLPEGWEPRDGAIRFKLSRNYPQQQPRAFMPAELTYNGYSPEIKLDHRGPDGWSEHCIHKMSDKWVPQDHSMFTMLMMMQKSFEHPNEEEPWDWY